MRLGLGLNFLHRLITVAEEVVVEVKYLLLEDGGFLMLDGPIQLLTEASDNLITQGGSSLAAEQSAASGKIELEQ
jgi:hypothetical protein